MSLWLYTSKRHRRSTGQNFEYYHDKKTGKPVYWLNDRQEPVERGPFIAEHSKMLNTENPQDALLLDYLKNHPGLGFRFELIDQSAVAAAEEKQYERYAQLTRQLLTYPKDAAAALFELLDYPDSSPASQAKLIQSMRDPNVAEKVADAMATKNSPVVLSIRRMVKFGVIRVENGTYVADHNNQRLAISEPQLADVLADDPDMLKILEGETNRRELDYKKREKTKTVDMSKM